MRSFVERFCTCGDFTEVLRREEVLIVLLLINLNPPLFPSTIYAAVRWLSLGDSEMPRRVCQLRFWFLDRDNAHLCIYQMTLMQRMS